MHCLLLPIFLLSRPYILWFIETLQFVDKIPAATHSVLLGQWFNRIFQTSVKSEFQDGLIWSFGFTDCESRSYIVVALCFRLWQIAISLSFQTTLWGYARVKLRNSKQFKIATKWHKLLFVQGISTTVYTLNRICWWGKQVKYSWSMEMWMLSWMFVLPDYVWL